MKQCTFLKTLDILSQNESKVVNLKEKLGEEGFEIYLFLIEFIQETDREIPLKIIQTLSFIMGVKSDKILAVIKDFELFQIVDNRFKMVA